MIRSAHVLGVIGAFACVAACGGSKSDPLARVGRGQLCVTDGEITEAAGGQLSVTTPAMRAVVPASSRPDVEARFAFLGPTDQTVALGSGAVRQQFGLKLRAADPCNLVYAMWRFAPKAGVVVQVKSNPGEHDSQTCKNHGYRDIAPNSVRTVDAPAIGRTYLLRAEMERSTLSVSIDGKVVWQGDVGSDAVALEGPVGVRSDNAKLSLALFAPVGSAPSGAPPPHCRPEGED
jgi:hypothetical protein